jgi:hypothetical protein
MNVIGSKTSFVIAYPTVSRLRIVGQVKTVNKEAIRDGIAIYR